MKLSEQARNPFFKRIYEILEGAQESTPDHSTLDQRLAQVSADLQELVSESEHKLMAMPFHASTAKRQDLEDRIENLLEAIASIDALDAELVESVEDLQELWTDVISYISSLSETCD